MMKIKKSIKKESKSDDKSNEDKAQKSSKTKGMPSKMMKSMAIPDTIPSKIVIRSLADFLWGVPDHEGKTKYPGFGFTVDDKDGKGFAIKRVIPESIAEEKDLKKNDIILSVDGHDFMTKNELRKYLGIKNWDDMIRFEILRDNETRSIEFKIEWKKKEN